jgi:iron complex outermembrane receptor protein
LNGDWKVGDNARITADLSYQNSQFDTQFLAMRIGVGRATDCPLA